MRGLRLAGLALLAWSACWTVRAQSYATMAGAPDPADFVRRTDSQMTLLGRPLRFGGVDIPWLGLRQDAGAAPRRPTLYEVRDALATASALGAGVIRLPGLAASAGCPLCLEPVTGQLSQAAVAQIDLVLDIARNMGLKVVLPLADAGGDCTQAAATGVICADARLAGAGQPGGQAFFTDLRARAAFAIRVRAILTHVNGLNGTAYKDDPTILAWEDCDACAASATDQAASDWAEWLGQTVKAIDDRHLYESGAFAGHIGPAAGTPAKPALYAPPSVDIVGDRPPIGGAAVAVRRLLEQTVTSVTDTKRAYVLDSFGWSPAWWHTQADLDAWLADLSRDRLLAGAFLAALDGHADQGGYLPPAKASPLGAASLYFPGRATEDADLATMQARGRALRRFNFAMVDVTLAPAYLLPPRPEILQARHGRIVWRGSAGAATYTIERSPDPSSPGTWTTLCDGCATDAAGFWQDPDPAAGPAWYRVMPLNINGHHNVPSPVVKAD